jgi:general stress protein 26
VKRTSVRIAGTCSVSTDKDDRETYLDLVPEVRSYFSGADDPRYVGLRIKVEAIRLMTQEGETLVDTPSA